MNHEDAEVSREHTGAAIPLCPVVRWQADLLQLLESNSGAE